MPLAYLPSPDQGVWHLGPLPIRAYAIAILLGVVAAVLIGERRYVARGGSRGMVVDVATVAVPAGIVGARLYHVITTPAPYFGPGGSLWRVLAVWEGGLGIWGGIAGGALAAAVMLRRRGLRAAPFADAVAPGIAVAQAIGRFGNYFNQELFGRPTALPWGLRIDPDNRDAVPGAVAYHPTFLYESLWNLAVAALLVWADRRWQLGGGRVFALYVAAYTAGRAWIEALRIDDAQLVLGLRLNVWTSLVLFVLALAFLIARRGHGCQDVRLIGSSPVSAH
jgi:prolipoprotein diacylglyceryl transferase